MTAENKAQSAKADGQAGSQPVSQTAGQLATQAASIDQAPTTFGVLSLLAGQHVHQLFTHTASQLSLDCHLGIWLPTRGSCNHQASQAAARSIN